jgi:P-type conjugative transfer protein TrbJ
MRYSVWKWNRKTSAYAARKFGRGAALALAMASAGLGVSLYMAPAPAYAIYCSNCSTFYQQMYEYAEAVNTQLNTAQQLQTQIQQYDNMIKQGMSLPSRMFNTITGDLQRVASVYNSAQSLGRNISNLDEQFRQQFKGYDSYLNSIGQGQNNMSQRYRDWAQSGFDNARTAMQAAGVNTRTFEDENAMLDQLVSRSQSAVGRQRGHSSRERDCGAERAAAPEAARSGGHANHPARQLHGAAKRTTVR